MSRVVGVALAGLLLAFTAGGPGDAEARPQRHRDEVTQLPRPSALGAAAQRRGATPITVYVNGGGGTLTGGWDDSSRDISSIAHGVGGDITVPAWRGGKRRWAQVMSCVRDRFAPFAIDVVDRRPAGAGYIMAMVGGRASLLGYPDGIAGVAPHTGDVIPGAVVFVFSDAIGNDLEQVCVDVLHEVGHALGLDHAYLCEDPMSYLHGCGEKRFQDVVAPCGEEEPRACEAGAEGQNSWRHLASTVGLRDGGGNGDGDGNGNGDGDGDGNGNGDEDEDGNGYDHAEPDVDDAWPDATGDAEPELAITSPGGPRSGERDLTVVVVARDDHGIVDVELAWASEEGQWLFACGALADDVPVTCQRDGDTFTFRLRVGTGLRVAAARATDTAGQQAISETQVLELEELRPQRRRRR